MSASLALAQTSSDNSPSPTVDSVAPESLGTYWIGDSLNAPSYPSAPFLDKTGGEVKIAFTIDATGATGNLEIVHAVPSNVFDTAVRAAVGQWRYTPATQNPDASPVRTYAILSFQPEGVKPARTKAGDLAFPSTPGAQGKDGWVRLVYDITSEGIVQNVLVLEARPAGIFDKAALRAVETRRYAPITVDGRSIPLMGQIDTVRFYGDHEPRMMDCVLADPTKASPFLVTDMSAHACPARRIGREMFLKLDYDGAQQVLRPLADAGDTEAVLLMGAMRDPRYHQISSRHVYMDAYFNANEAVRWYRVGVDAGDPYSTLHLIVMGNGIRNALPPGSGPPEALFAKWGYQPRVLERLSRSALKFRLEDGDGVAAFHYSMIMIHEPSGGHWLRVARDMLEHDAKKGSGLHQWLAGRVYSVGPRYGLRPDLPRAFAWFSAASASGVEHARGYQYAIGEQLRPRQYQEAETLAKEYLSSYVLPQ